MTPPSRGNPQGSSGDNEKRTPRALFDFLNRRYRFTYDAMAAHGSALCDTYSTKDGTFVRNAARGRRGLPYTPIDSLDGLRQEWFGRRVFLNPPYGRGIFADSMDKMVAERDAAEIIVGLLKADTSTAAWRRLAEVSDITYLPRITYVGESHPSTFASAIVVVRASVEAYPTK